MPSQHPDYQLFTDHEGASLVALGFTDQAVERYLRLVEVFTHRAQNEPDRADYQRGLSISYERLGDLYRVLGQGEQARTLYQQSLDIATRLAQAEPDRVDCMQSLSIGCFRVRGAARRHHRPDHPAAALDDLTGHRG